MDDLELIMTEDGSHTLRNGRLNETYHSVHGALQESMHVFIGNGLEYYAANHPGQDMAILEVGFGTGLNALITAQYTMYGNIRIRYVSIEPFPLPEEVWSALNYGDPDKGGHLFNALHETPWNREVPVLPGFKLFKIKDTLESVELKKHYDIIYFDAFGPQVQPALWSYASLEKVVSRLNPGGIFVTYSAKGQLKRDLKALGLKVETLPGPPGKNEMVRATKP